MSGYVHYAVTAKNRHHGEAIAAGWQARIVPAAERRLVPGAHHLIGGLAHGSLELMQALRPGERYVFFDRAYFGGGPGTDRLRAVPDAYQHHWPLPVPPGGADRLAKTWGVRLAPWQPPGRHVLVVPPGAAIRRLFGLGDWEAEVLAVLHHATDRPVRVSAKGDPVPLAERLRDCHAVVTFTSNVAVEAVVAGVPAFCAPSAAAAPVSGRLDTLAAAIEAPPRPAREAWAQGLAWGQWTLEELRDGTARRALEDSSCRPAS